MFWLTDHCHKERAINCQQAPWPEDDETPLRLLSTFVWSTWLKVRTAVPTWLLYNISVYKNRPWKIKNGISSSKDWSPHVARSLTFWLNYLECGGSSSLLIMPGLLRSDRGGLSVSSPSREREDACGLHRWRKFLALESLAFHVNQAIQPLFSTEFSYWATLILLLFISLINI